MGNLVPAYTMYHVFPCWQKKKIKKKFSPWWREAIMVKCLVQGHKHHGRSQDSKPHSDDSAIRTQIRCTKLLDHGTPIKIVVEDAVLVPSPTIERETTMTFRSDCHQLRSPLYKLGTLQYWSSVYHCSNKTSKWIQLKLIQINFDNIYSGLSCDLEVQKNTSLSKCCPKV